MEADPVFEDDQDGEKSKQLKEAVKKTYKLHQTKKSLQFKGRYNGRGSGWRGRGGRGGFGYGGYGGYGGKQGGFGAKRQYRQEAYMPMSYGAYIPPPPPQPHYPPPAAGPQAASPICWKCV